MPSKETTKYLETSCSARTYGHSVLIDIYMFITIKSKAT